MYTEKDLVSFGEYLLSEERDRRFRVEHENAPYSYDGKEKLVHESDIANWKYLQEQ